MTVSTSTTDTECPLCRLDSLAASFDYSVFETYCKIRNTVLADRPVSYFACPEHADSAPPHA